MNGPVLHGYTLDQLDHMARLVVAANLQWWPAGDRKDQAEAAWMGIVEYLCEAPERPARNDLLAAGTAALAREVRELAQLHGSRRDGSNSGAKFARYWSWHSSPARSPEEHVTERVALAQIWWQMKPRHREALTALAAAGDHRGAAAVLGVCPGYYDHLLRKSRKAFRALWHEGEKPSRQYRNDRLVQSYPTDDPAELEARARYVRQVQARRREAAK